MVGRNIRLSSSHSNHFAGCKRSLPTAVEELVGSKPWEAGADDGHAEVGEDIVRVGFLVVGGGVDSVVGGGVAAEEDVAGV